VRPRQAAAWALRAGLALGLGLMVAEGALRLPTVSRRLLWKPPIYPGERADRPSTSFAGDPLVGWRLRPEHRFEWVTEGRRVAYRSDARGFRVGDHSRDGSRTRRLVLLGDSFVFGFGVGWDESLAGRLEARFPEWEVLNMAQPGFGLDQIAVALEAWALPLDPEAVVVGLLSEDLARCETAYREVEGFNKPLFQLAGGELVRLTPERAPGPARRFLERHSKLIALFRQLDRVIGKRLGRGAWWARNEALLERMRTRLESTGTPALFLLFPKPDPDPVPALAAYAERRGLDFVDLTTGPGRPAAEHYLPRDGHFSARGHAYLFELVERWLSAGPAR